MPPDFTQLNLGWNAEPNAPSPTVSFAGTALILVFVLNHMIFNATEEELGRLIFDDCSVWRLGAENDEGWFLGKFRYSGIAPKWGEFYEVAGGDNQQPQPNDWNSLAGKGSRHVLFYLRDETFECKAASWQFERSGKLA